MDKPCNGSCSGDLYRSDFTADDSKNYIYLCKDKCLTNKQACNETCFGGTYEFKHKHKL